MGFFSRLFKRKNKCPGCGFDISKASFVVSSGIVRCPVCGTDITSQLKPVVDLRSDEEKQIEMRAILPLEEEYEQMAYRLYTFMGQAEPLSEALYDRLNIGLTVEEWANRSLEKLPKNKYRRYKSDIEAYIKLCKEIRRIGEQLCENEDDRKMRLVAYRFRALGGNARVLESYWKGICRWMP